VRECVALVNMPFFGTNRPSLGLGLLKAALKARGIESRILYINLDYAALVGINAYRMIEGSPSGLLLGEWIFADALWGPNPARDEEYRRLLPGSARAGASAIHEQFSNEEVAQVIAQARARAGDFIEYCVQSTAWDDYKVVGFSSIFQQQVSSLALAKRLKARYPDLYCVFGGANCEDEMGRALFESFPFVDAVCTGEGESVFPDLVARVLDKTPARVLAGMHQRDSCDPPSSAAGEASGPGVASLPPAPLVSDIGSLPLPAYDDFFASKCIHPRLDEGPLVIPFETSRGCWWGQKQHCTFCGLNGVSMGFREKPPVRALEEIMSLGDRYGRYTRQFEAADNILPMSYFKSLLPELARLDLGYRLFYETKSNLRPEQVRLLSRAGVTSIQPGIESLSTAVLKIMRKGVTKLQNVQLLKSCAQYGVRPYWNYLVGFPGETEGDYAGQTDLFQSISHLTPPSTGGAGRVRFDRFSPYMTRPGEWGLHGVAAHPAYRLIYDGLSEAAVSRLAYFFEGRFAGDEEIPDRLERLSVGVREWRSVHEQSALFSQEIDQALIVFDFRPISRHPQIVLRDPWRTLYQDCTAIRGRDALRDRFDQLCRGEGRPAGHFERGMEKLLDRRLLIQEGDQYLSLALTLDCAYHLPDQPARRFSAMLSDVPGPPIGAPPIGLGGMPFSGIS
jgi:ribosomal peptide maturation radical SAM protein 1